MWTSPLFVIEGGIEVKAASNKHPTPNIQSQNLQRTHSLHWKLDVGRWVLPPSLLREPQSRRGKSSPFPLLTAFRRSTARFASFGEKRSKGVSVTRVTSACHVSRGDVVCSDGMSFLLHSCRRGAGGCISRDRFGNALSRSLRRQSRRATKQSVLFP